MDQAKAESKYVRIAPRKARRAAALIRGLPVVDAYAQLTYGQSKGCELLRKTLRSAIANAEDRLELRREDLTVLEVRVDEGPTLKRARSRARGSRSPIMKRTSHLTVVVGT